MALPRWAAQGPQLPLTGQRAKPRPRLQGTPILSEPLGEVRPTLSLGLHKHLHVKAIMNVTPPPPPLSAGSSRGHCPDLRRTESQELTEVSEK